LFAGYDIIGDVHGCVKPLETLLQKLGYGKCDGVYQYSDARHPRQVIFLGDVLDRGPAIREAVDLVRGMIDRGSAQMIMGNHEYHALCYCTPAPEADGNAYLREHTPRHAITIRETLDQYANYSAEWTETLEWIQNLPVFLEFDHFRVVHACWDQRLIGQYQEQYHSAVINKAFLIESADYRTFAGRFMSRLTQGVGLMLPDKKVMLGSHGFERRSFRAKFWVDEPQTYGDVEFQPDRLPDEIAEYALSDKQREHIGYYGTEQKSLFIGHYWMAQKPRILTNNIACLDYSTHTFDRLVAYRMDDSHQLRDENFVWVGEFNQ
jgi:hypothetical protein